MTSDRLLTEIERQKKYLEELPQNFEFPLFNSKHALESQRRNGYRNTAAAAREIVDNAIEAGAKNVHVALERGATDEKFSRHETVRSVAFIDDGSGMLPRMAQFALCLGGGTHFDDPSFIGKFGFGLPNSSINQTKRVEVYTKVKDDPKVYMTVLDVNAVSATGKQSIDPAVEADLPGFVQRYLKQEKWKFEHGSVIVWVSPDRLTYRTGGALRDHLIDDFGVVYRYLLRDLSLKIDGTDVHMVDPLFLDPDGQYFVDPAAGGALVQLDRMIPVRYFNDPESGRAKLKRVEPEELDQEDPTLIAAGGIHVRLSRFPLGFLKFTNSKRVQTDENRRAEVRKDHAGMSFVRAKREIQTITSFPQTQKDKAAGLGSWPMLQGYAYHIGIEVRFQPQLDEVFGITNDKQTVMPIDEFWRLMEAEGVDRLVSSEYRLQVKMRDDARKEAKLKEAERSIEPTAAETAAATADQVQGTVPKIPDHLKPVVKERSQVEIERRAKVLSRSIEEIETAFIREAKARPYVIDFYEDPNGPFFKPEWDGPQVVIRINKRHPFFDSLYIEAMKLDDGDKVRQAINVLLIALGRAELTVENETTQEWYQAQRERVWSPFLKDSMRVLARSLADDIEEIIEEDDAAEA